MMQDTGATFYGGYDQLYAVRRSPMRISAKVFAIAVALLLLLVFVAVDVSALETRPSVVQVTLVNWYAEGSLLTTSGGFSMHSGQTVSLSLTCSAYCYRLNGVASVSAPFTLVGLSVTYAPIQYANVTVQAPASGYDGPLTITLGVG